MSQESISVNDSHPRKRITAGGVDISYVDTGSGNPIVFLHGNPTSSYLWRNIIPHLEFSGRCLAPDLMGMGESGSSPNGSYRFADHSALLDQWFEDMGLTSNVTLVIHDWGSALGFHWANQHPDAVNGLCYMEAIVAPIESWDDFPNSSRDIFQGFRSSAGEEMVLEKNTFVERVLPGSILRTLTDEEMAEYRRPFAASGEGRRPTLTWPRQIPIEGKPADVTSIVAAYADWLSGSDVKKLFINAEPGALLTGRQREICRRWPNQTEVTVAGSHFMQEDSPDDISAAIVSWLTDSSG